MNSADEYMRLAADAVAHNALLAADAVRHSALLARERISQAAQEYERPCVVYRPRIFIDGDAWCALLGSNIQDGVCGFGASPAAAMRAFDEAWHKPLTVPA